MATRHSGGDRTPARCRGASWPAREPSDGAASTAGGDGPHFVERVGSKGQQQTRFAGDANRTVRPVRAVQQPVERELAAFVSVAAGAVAVQKEDDRDGPRLVMRANVAVCRVEGARLVHQKVWSLEVGEL